MPELTATPRGRSSATSSLWAAGIYCVALLLMFHHTSWSLVSIWIRSDTYAHGFLILPISLWLMWSQRAQLVTINARPAPWIAALIAPVGFVWLLGYLVDVLLVQQLALISILIVGVWTILGHSLARVLAFPLLFLFFAVPMGDSLIPPLMEFTATSTVWLIQQTGIPVFREGLYFSLPSGNWSVVEACSGQRYLIASVTLGVLYAYLTYSSFKRRALFVLASIIVPIFANAIRAYIIVMLGHLSGMTIATGVDHLVYGWVFFGLVMFLLFWLGSLFREDGIEPTAVKVKPDNRDSNAGGLATKNLIAATLIVLIAAVTWPLLASYAQHRSNTAVMKISLSQAEENSDLTILAEPHFRWQPEASTTGLTAVNYDFNGQPVALFIQYSNGVMDESEVVGSSTRFTNRDSGQRVVSLAKANMQLDINTVAVDQAQLDGTSGKLLAWSWYRIGGLYTSNNYLAKLHEAAGSLGLEAAGSYRIVVVTRLSGTVASAQDVLQNFLDVYQLSLDEAFAAVAELGR